MAAKEFFASHTPTIKNLPDLFTKVLYVQKLQNLVKGLLCDIYDHERDVLNWFLFCEFFHNVRKLNPMR